jgi:hypothetical protein
MTATRRNAAAVLVAGLPQSLAGTLCTCHHGRRPGLPHPASYVLAIGHTKVAGCVSAAAAFAATNGIPFPLTSGTPPEAP